MWMPCSASVVRLAKIGTSRRPWCSHSHFFALVLLVATLLASAGDTGRRTNEQEAQEASQTWSLKEGDEEAVYAEYKRRSGDKETLTTATPTPSPRTLQIKYSEDWQATVNEDVKDFALSHDLPAEVWQVTAFDRYDVKLREPPNDPELWPISFIFTRRPVATEAPPQPDAPSTDEAPAAEADAFSYHKELLPVNTMDWITFVCAALSLVIAAGGGIGGGGVLVPLYMIMLQFRPKHAIALSNFTILGGSIANTFFNVQKTLPNGKPLIDWDIIVMMEPSTIAGAVIGSFLSKFLPDFVITICLAIVLGLLSWRMVEKGISMFRKETVEMQALESKTKETEMTSLGPVGKDESERLMPPSSSTEGGAPPPSIGFPWDKIMLLIVCFIGCIVLTILKGSGDGSIIGVECGSKMFWILGMGNIPWTFAFCVIFRCMLMSEHAAKQQATYQFQEGEIEWNNSATIKYPLICTLAGVFAGLFGVGGGILKGPLMLEMGVQPAVASATAAQMILFTTSAACVSFHVFGLLEPKYGCFFFVMGIACTAIGQAGINAYMKAAKRQSPPVISIALIMVLSTVLVVFEAYRKSMELDLADLIRPSSLCAK